MRPVAPLPLETRRPPAPLGRGVLAAGLGGVTTVGAAILLAAAAGAGMDAGVRAGLLYLLVAGGILVGLRRGSAGSRFGLANSVTLGRAALVCGLAGLIGSDASPAAGGIAASVGLLAFLLDGLDGWIARRTGTSSTFGASFDREVDALFVLILAMLVVDLRGAPSWILLVGMFRYGFVAGRLVWPWLAGELPPSQRRRVVFGLQVLLLLACLLPPVPPDLVFLLAAGALTLVSASFATDILWLRRSAASGPPPCRAKDLR